MNTTSGASKASVDKLVKNIRRKTVPDHVNQERSLSLRSSVKTNRAAALVECRRLPAP